VLRDDGGCSALHRAVKLNKLARQTHTQRSNSFSFSLMLWRRRAGELERPFALVMYQDLGAYPHFYRTGYRNMKDKGTGKDYPQKGQNGVYQVVSNSSPCLLRR